MEIYIEYVLLDNFIINYLILFFTKFLAQSKVKKINLLVSNVFGVVSAVLLPLVTLNIVFMLPLKTLIGVIMVLMLKKYNNFKQFLAHLLIFFTFTFVFGGLCYALINVFDLNTTASGVLINGYEIPMGIIMLLVSIYVYFLIKLVQFVRHKNEFAGYYYDVTIKLDNKKYYLRGYLDSGNKLYDDGLPVVVVSFKTFCKLFSKLPIENYFLQKTEKLGLKNAHYITVNNVVGKGKMLVFSVDELVIQNSSTKKFNSNMLIGISNKTFSTEYDCLLHSECLKGWVC